MVIKGVFDTNILIDYLNGINDAKNEFSNYDIKIISIITWMEVLVGIEEKTEEEKVKRFLHRFKIVFIDQEISEIAINIKRKRRIKLPDALIWATSIKENAVLVTRNIKDFPKTELNIRIPY